jgi:hypothetical protein
LVKRKAWQGICLKTKAKQYGEDKMHLQYCPEFINLQK